MKKGIKICAIAVGLVFLLSGYAKSADAAYFSYLLERSGGVGLAMMSPAVILVELIVGWLLVLQIRPRLMAWMGIALSTVLTIGFAYLRLRHGMVSCGCFGHLNALNLPLGGTIVRNVVMIGLLLWVALKGEKIVEVKSWKWIILAAGLVVGAFATGLTFARSHVVTMQENDTTHYAVADSPLDRMVSISPDSTYMVFVFATECQKCYNSFGNVLLYEQEKKVDRVIGLAAGDVGPLYDVPFGYTLLPLDTVLLITDDIPAMMLIRNDSVVMTRYGSVIAPSLLN